MTSPSSPTNTSRNRLSFVSKKYAFFTTSEKAWDAMLATIQKAQKSIYLEMYIFLADTTESHDFVTALETKLLSGVSVALVLDAFGSKSFQQSAEAERLRSAGAEIIFYSSWFRHIHRKLLLVDESIGFLGGVNIGKQYALWNDLQVRIQHKLLVSRLLASFASTYAMAGGQNKDILVFRSRPLERRIQWWIVDHWPMHNIHSLKRHFIKHIGRAKKSVRIVTPYFAPPRWLISILDTAIQRGVTVEIIIPRKSEHINRINYRYAARLHAIGIRFFLSEEMNHSKLLLIDDATGLVGSQNIDFLSFHFNSEIGIFSKESEFVKELGIIWHRWRAQATPFFPDRYRMYPIDYLILLGMKIFQPIL